MNFSVPFDWALKRKKQYIANQMSQIKKQILFRKKFKPNNINEKQLIQSQIGKLEKEFNSYKNYLNYLNHPEQDKRTLTDEEIEIAKNYPIKEFLPDDYKGKGNVNCPFHEDKHPSCQVNVTTIYCHTCNKAYNAIDLYRHFNGTDFKTTVKLLARS
ncbi:MAG: CHC2 zinc finger domain-containing protein [bacterium]